MFQLCFAIRTSSRPTAVVFDKFGVWNNLLLRSIYKLVQCRLAFYFMNKIWIAWYIDEGHKATDLSVQKTEIYYSAHLTLAI